MDLVKPITSDHDLIKLAKRMEVRLNDILDLPEIKSPLPRKGAFIILLRTDGGTGHWVAVNDGKYFDSTGAGPPTVLGKMPYNEFQYQSSYSEFCGIWCLLWLYSEQKNRPDLMRDFKDLDIDII